MSLAGPAHAACGDTACAIDGGTYEISLPEGAGRGDAQVPTVVFLHGYGGSANGVMNMRAMVAGLHQRGYAVIAPNGLPRPNGPRSWGFIPEFETRAEVTFLRAVVEDAAERFHVDPDRAVLAGFSAGGFMVNYGACSAPESFAAYAPVAGGFWRPQPESCAGPVRLFHSHGWSDGVVPLEGRILGGGRYVQGDIWAGLEVWRETNGCETHAPTAMSQDGDLMIRDWHCGEDAEIRFELFSGGHQVPQGWADRLVDWFETVHTEG